MASEIVCATRADWLQRRREGVTASEIAAILGLSPWLSAFSLYWQKVTGYEEPDDAQKARGRRLERLVREDFIAAHHDMLTAMPIDAHRHTWGTGAPYVVMYAHDERPWQLATPDAFAWPTHVASANEEPGAYDNAGNSIVLGQRMPLELKTARNRHGWGHSGTDVVPAHYRAQLLWQMDVLGADQGWLAVWIGFDDYREYLIERDDDDIAVMREAAEEFLDAVNTEQPPPVDGLANTTATLRRLHPSLTDESVEVPDELITDWEDARRMLTGTKAYCRELENNLRAKMGSAVRAVNSAGDVVATRTVYERRSYEVAPATIDRLWGRAS